MKDDSYQVLVRLSIKDCGRAQNGNRAGLEDGKGSSADGKRLQDKIIRKGNADRSI